MCLAPTVESINIKLALRRLLALGMELPEETLVKRHDFDDKEVKFGERLELCAANI